MLQAFIIMLREGFEAFLIVAIILSYLNKTQQRSLVSSVYWGVLASLVASGVMGYLLYQGAANRPLMEGWTGLLSAVLVAWLVVHMWKTAPHMKNDMEVKLGQKTGGKSSGAAYWGVLIFTILMISREGMETALLLIQIHEPRIVSGMVLGALAASLMAIFWLRFSKLINIKLFFQVTAIFLLLFVVQILIYSFHEFTEAGALPYSEALHRATEPFSPEGLYGKWFSLGMVFVCAAWLCGAWLLSKRKNPESHTRLSA